MIDIHSHILPAIDDGSRNVEETIELIKEAKEAGFSTIISTSHYWEEHYEVSTEDRQKIINAISKKIADKPYNLDIYIGSEIFVTSDISQLIKDGEASSLNNNRYVLFELPFETIYPNLKDVIYNLLNNGYTPIIAHPERYSYVQDDPNLLIDYIEIGVLFQSNYGSLIGQYGKRAQKTVKLLLKNNLVHFLGSDVHRQGTVYKRIPESLAELKKLISDEEIQELTHLNQQAVLDNKEIYVRRPKRIKRGIFGF